MLFLKSNKIPVSLKNHINFFEKSNNLFIVGGDGTYLRALAGFSINSIPNKVYAFANGTVGALLPLNSNDLENIEISDDILEEKYKSIKRYRLNLESHKIMFSNELVFRSKNFKLNSFLIKINNYEFSIRGDAIIISTPSGSTGYNFSSNGPIILNNSIIINCVAPNNCNFRPIVLNIDSKIEISGKDISAYADTIEIKNKDKYIINGYDSYNLVVNKEYSFINSIKSQMNLK